MDVSNSEKIKVITDKALKMIPPSGEIKLATPVMVMGNAVNIIRNTSGGIALDYGRKPYYYPSDMNGPELDGLYRTLIGTQLLQTEKHRVNFATAVPVKISGPKEGMYPDDSYIESQGISGGDDAAAVQASNGTEEYPVHVYGTLRHGQQERSGTQAGILLSDLDFSSMKVVSDILDKNLAIDEARKNTYLAYIRPLSSKDTGVDKEIFESMKDEMTNGNGEAVLALANTYDDTPRADFNLSSVFRGDLLDNAIGRDGDNYIRVASDKVHSVIYDKSTDTFHIAKTVTKEDLHNSILQDGIDENTPDMVRDLAKGFKDLNYINDDDSRLKTFNNELQKLASGHDFNLSTIKDVHDMGEHTVNGEHYYRIDYSNLSIGITVNPSKATLDRAGVNAIQVRDNTKGKSAKYVDYHLSSEMYADLAYFAEPAAEQVSKRNKEIHDGMTACVLNHEREDWLDLGDSEYIGVQMGYDDNDDANPERFYLRSTSYDPADDVEIMDLPIAKREEVFETVKKSYSMNRLYDILEMNEMSDNQVFAMANPVRLSNGEECRGFIRFHGEEGYTLENSAGNYMDFDDSSLSASDYDKLTRGVLVQNVLGTVAHFPDIFKDGRDLAGDTIIIEGTDRTFNIKAVNPVLDEEDNVTDVKIRERYSDRTLNDFSDTDLVSLANQLNDVAEYLRHNRSRIPEFENRYKPLDVKPGDRVSVKTYGYSDDIFVVTKRYGENIEGYYASFSAGNVAMTVDKLQGYHDSYKQVNARQNGQIQHQDPGNIFYALIGRAYKRGGDDPTDALFNGDSALADFLPQTDFEKDAAVEYTDGKWILREARNFENVYSRFSDNSGYISEINAEGDRYAVGIIDDGDYPVKGNNDEHDYAEGYVKFTRGEMLTQIRALPKEEFEKARNIITDEYVKSLFDIVVKERQAKESQKELPSKDDVSLSDKETKEANGKTDNMEDNKNVKWYGSIDEIHAGNPLYDRLKELYDKGSDNMPVSALVSLKNMAGERATCGEPIDLLWTFPNTGAVYSTDKEITGFTYNGEDISVVARNTDVPEFLYFDIMKGVSGKDVATRITEEAGHIKSDPGIYPSAIEDFATDLGILKNQGVSKEDKNKKNYILYSPVGYFQHPRDVAYLNKLREEGNTQKMLRLARLMEIKDYQIDLQHTVRDPRTGGYSDMIESPTHVLVYNGKDYEVFKKVTPEEIMETSDIETQIDALRGRKKEDVISTFSDDVKSILGVGTLSKDNEAQEKKGLHGVIKGDDMKAYMVSKENEQEESQERPRGLHGVIKNCGYKEGVASSDRLGDAVRGDFVRLSHPVTTSVGAFDTISLAGDVDNLHWEASLGDLNIIKTDDLNETDYVKIVEAVKEHYANKEKTDKAVDGIAAATGNEPFTIDVNNLTGEAAYKNLRLSDGITADDIVSIQLEYPYYHRNATGRTSYEGQPELTISAWGREVDTTAFTDEDWKKVKELCVAGLGKVREEPEHVAEIPNIENTGHWHGEKQKEARADKEYYGLVGKLMCFYKDNYASEHVISPEHYVRARKPQERLLFSIWSEMNDFRIPVYFTSEDAKDYGGHISPLAKPVSIMVEDEEGRRPVPYYSVEQIPDYLKKAKEGGMIQDYKEIYKNRGNAMRAALEEELRAGGWHTPVEFVDKLDRDDYHHAYYDRDNDTVFILKKDITEPTSDLRADEITGALTDSLIIGDRIQQQNPHDSAYYETARLMNAIEFNTDLINTREWFPAYRVHGTPEYSRLRDDPEYARDVIEVSSHVSQEITDYAEGRLKVDIEESQKNADSVSLSDHDVSKETEQEESQERPRGLHL